MSMQMQTLVDNSPTKGAAAAAKGIGAALKKETEPKKKTSSGSGGRRSAGKGGSGGGSVLVTAVSLPGNYGQPREDPYWEAMRAHYETVYADALEESGAAARRASASARQEAERQSAALTGEYEGLNRQLYRDYMEHSRTLPQELAARGYTGGVSESARVRLRNSYEEALAENTRERIRRQSELETVRAQAEEKARTEAAEREAAARRSLQQSLASLMKERHSQTRAEDLRRAEVLASAGDFSGYRALGWSEGEIGYLSAVWAARNPEVAGAVYGLYA